jgi:hypothetical protein
MVTAFNLIYSAAAVRRILGLAFPVVRIEKWWKVVLVVFKGCRPRFMSRAAFLKHFVEWRKAQARVLRVTQRLDAGIGLRPAEGVQFTVRNENKNSVYIVQAMPSGLLCECEDYKNQLQFLGKGCCKHGYAVLAHLGFESLQNYLAALGENGYLRSRTG